MDNCYIGIDVGTGSARAGIFTSEGVMLSSASNPIKIWKYDQDFVEQSSNDIWESVCHCVRESIKKAKIQKDDITGIGFDATCSLVAIDSQDKPVSVSKSNENERNVIVWMDHRAIAETNFINSTKHEVLKYVGGKISPEMETPKLLWLKKHHPECWQKTAKFFDLPDFLVYKATGQDVRSLCSTVCKWTYMGHVKRINSESVGSWDDSYFKAIGLEDLSAEGYQRIGTRVRPIAESVPGGLSKKSSLELGLKEGTALGVSIIDAHAGGIGMLGAILKDENRIDFSRRLALIGGTSSCHMAVSPNPSYVPGVWGPYFSAMLPGMWLSEGGQSATGALVDHIIFSHTKAAELISEAEKANKTVYELLNAKLDEMSSKVRFPAELTRGLHILPYFHGNRSPRANPLLRGMISGLKLSDSIEELVLLYLATIQAIAYGTKHIIEEMNNNGYKIDTIFICGGGTKNPVFIREHADITQCTLVLSKEPEAVLLGSAILGMAASGGALTVQDGMSKMCKAEKIIEPAKGLTASYHIAKYGVFKKMYEDQMNYKSIMADL
ncbi:MAG TPA: ribulokinase [Lentisphaeria bacterium]|nr:MAG: ribulokinase [Lentisphaerae bacterium GWF2_38_69]HBM15484.1 ribulokinase [Lentisphaeria bacterium]